MIDYIVSNRNIYSDNFRQIVYEWEDNIFESKGIDIVLLNKVYLIKPVRNLLSVVKNIKQDIRNNVGIAYCMTVDEYRFYSCLNLIPVFIDVWPKDIDKLIAMMNDNVFFVTSLDIYNIISCKCRNVSYMPLVLYSHTHSLPSL